MKTFKLFGLALMAVLLSVGFAACGDDDDEDAVSSEIVGTWVADSYTTVTFNSNGTGYTTETYNGETETYNFTYTYNAETGVLKVTADGETITMTNVKIKGNTLTYVDEEGDTETLTKKGSSTDDNGGSSDQETSGDLLTSVTYAGHTLYSAEYDSKNRVTEFYCYGTTFYYTYNNSGKLESMKFYDEDEWVYLNNIEFTSAGNIKSLKQTTDDGWYSNMTLTYDSNDRLTKVYTVDYDGEKTITNFTWENGCLMSIDYEEKDVVDDPDGADEFHCTFTYSDKINTKKCYTAACSPLIPQFLMMGLVGQGYDYLPASYTEDGETYNLSYTTDDDGKILTETANGMDFIYNYGTSSSVKQHKLASAKQGSMKLPTMPCILGKRK